MFSIEQPDYEFNWEDMDRKVLHIMVSKDSYDGKEETTMVMGGSERLTHTMYCTKKPRGLTNERTSYRRRVGVVS